MVAGMEIRIVIAKVRGLLSNQMVAKMFAKRPRTSTVILDSDFHSGNFFESHLFGNRRYRDLDIIFHRYRDFMFPGMLSYLAIVRQRGGEVRVGYLSDGGMNVTFLSLYGPKISTMHCVALNKIDPSCIQLVSVMPSHALRQHYSTQSWPLPSRLTGISRKGRVFQTIFPRVGPSKNCATIFLTRLPHCHRPLEGGGEREREHDVCTVNVECVQGHTGS